MKIAIMTNNGKTVAKHIGLAKQIAFYRLPEGTLIEMVPNPVMQRIKSEHIELKKAEEGNRHLGTGHIIPAFLAEKGVDALITHEFGKGVKDNLLAFGITPVVAENSSIEAIIDDLKKSEDS